MLSQFTNCLLLFILLSFYVATVIRFHKYLINENEDEVAYIIVSFIWSLITAPYACFYGVMEVIADFYGEEETTEETTEENAG